MTFSHIHVFYSLLIKYRRQHQALVNMSSQQKATYENRVKIYNQKLRAYRQQRVDYEEYSQAQQELQELKCKDLRNKWSQGRITNSEEKKFQNECINGSPSAPSNQVAASPPPVFNVPKPTSIQQDPGAFGIDAPSQPQLPPLQKVKPFTEPPPQLNQDPAYDALPLILQLANRCGGSFRVRNARDSIIEMSARRSGNQCILSEGNQRQIAFTTLNRVPDEIQFFQERRSIQLQRIISPGVTEWETLYRNWQLELTRLNLTEPERLR